MSQVKDSHKNDWIDDLLRIKDRRAMQSAVDKFVASRTRAEAPKPKPKPAAGKGRGKPTGPAPQVQRQPRQPRQPATPRPRGGGKGKGKGRGNAGPGSGRGVRPPRSSGAFSEPPDQHWARLTALDIAAERVYHLAGPAIVSIDQSDGVVAFQTDDRLTGPHRLLSCLVDDIPPSVERAESIYRIGRGSAQATVDVPCRAAGRATLLVWANPDANDAFSYVRFVNTPNVWPVAADLNISTDAGALSDTSTFTSIPYDQDRNPFRTHTLAGDLDASGVSKPIAALLRARLEVTNLSYRDPEIRVSFESISGGTRVSRRSPDGHTHRWMSIAGTAITGTAMTSGGAYLPTQARPFGADLVHGRSASATTIEGDWQPWVCGYSAYPTGVLYPRWSTISWPQSSRGAWVAVHVSGIVGKVATLSIKLTDCYGILPDPAIETTGWQSGSGITAVPYPYPRWLKKCGAVAVVHSGTAAAAHKSGGALLASHTLTNSGAVAAFPPATKQNIGAVTTLDSDAPEGRTEQTFAEAHPYLSKIWDGMKKVEHKVADEAKSAAAFTYHHPLEAIGGAAAGVYFLPEMAGASAVEALAADAPLMIGWI